MNKLAKRYRFTTSSYLLGKNYTYKRLYCKLNNIDTIIMDKEIYFDCNNLYNGNKYLKNIIIDLNNPENFVSIDLGQKTTIENISYLNFPKLDGITIPLEVLDKGLGFTIFVAPDRTNIKKINLLNGENIEEINLDETVSWYKIKKIKENNENKLVINIGYINSDKKTITYDTLGNKNVFYETQTIKENDKVDLREYENTTIINYQPKKKYRYFYNNPKNNKK